MEFALDQLQVRHVIVCGHSDCGAMKALCAGIEKLDLHFLKSWLRHGEEALVRVRAKKQDLSFNEEVKAVSQANVLLQLEHLKTYGRVAESVRNGKLMLHGLWFDIQNTDVYYANLEDGAFRVIDDIEGDKILRRLGLS